jgi:hypothetical protein
MLFAGFFLGNLKTHEMRLFQEHFSIASMTGDFRLQDVPCRLSLSVPFRVFCAFCRQLR